MSNKGLDSRLTKHINRSLLVLVCLILKNKLLASLEDKFTFEKQHRESLL